MVKYVHQTVTENRVNSNIFNSLYSLRLKMKRASLSMSYMIKKYKKRHYIYKKCITIWEETQQINKKTCTKTIKKTNI